MDAVVPIGVGVSSAVPRDRTLRVLFLFSGNNAALDPVIAVQREALVAEGLEVVLFPVIGRGLNGYARVIPSLRKRVKSEAVDIVHAHYGLCGIVGALATGCQGLVVSFMGSDIIGAVDHDGRATVVGTTVAFVSKLLARYAYPATIVKSYALEPLLWKGTSASVIPNGVDLDRFRPLPQLDARARAGLPPNGAIVLFAANPERPEKNFALAQAAIERLADPRVTLITAHSEPHDRMVNLYNAADVLLLTSWHEGSPNVVKEAMACNCPIVATETGDVRAIISGTAGCHVTTFDADDVAVKLGRALTERRRTDGRAAMQSYDRRRMAARMAEIYRRVASAHSRLH